MIMTHKEFLEKLVEELKTKGLECFLLPKEETNLPLDVVTIKLYKDYKQREQFLSLSFYPLDKQDSPVKYLQLFTQLNMELNDTKLVNSTFILPHINAQLPLGHFGMNFKENKIYFKFVHTFGNENKLDAKVVNDNIEMIQYTLEILSPTFMRIEEEQMDFEKILEHFQKHVRF